MIKIVLVSCMMLTASICHCQIPMGFKGGINTNEMVLRSESANSSGGYEQGISFHISVFTKLKLSNKFSLIPELQLIQKQAKATDTKIKLTYIELPVVISYQPIRWLSVEGGPSIGYKIGDSTDRNYFESIDIGLTGGLRFNISSQFSVLGRYYYGLTPVGEIYFTNSAGGTAAEFIFYNQGLQFSLSYYLK